MIKSIVCEREQVDKFLNNMERLGYSVHNCIIGITQIGAFYTVFYNYIERLGEPSENITTYED